MINVFDAWILTILLAFLHPKIFTMNRGYHTESNPPIAIQTGFYLIGRGRAQSIPTISLLKLGLLGDKGFALNQCVHECGYGMIFFLRGRGNFIGQVLVGKPKGTAQTVSDQMLSKTTGKIIFFLSD